MPKAKKRTIFTNDFWLQATERAIKTFAQTAVALIGAGLFNLLTTDWVQLIGVSGGAALLSILTSVASAKVHDDDSPSLV